MTLFSPFETEPLTAAASSSASKAGRRLTHGRLDLEFVAAPDARTFLARQYASHPFHVCRTQFLDDDLEGFPTLYIQSCSGGLYEDDRLELRIVAQARAEAHVTTQASTVVHSTLSGFALQQAEVVAREQAYIEYLPDPQILFPNSRCSSAITVRISPGATALVCDSFLPYDPFGADEVFSTYIGEVRIEDETGKALAIDRLNIDGHAFASRRPGTTGLFNAQGTFIVARTGLANTILGEFSKIRFDYQEAAIGVSLLPRDAGLIVRILAADGEALKRAMHASLCAARLALKGLLPGPRRK